MADLDGKCFVVKNRTLVPADFAADEFMAELKPGSEVVVQVRKARNPAHLTSSHCFARCWKTPMAAGPTKRTCSTTSRSAGHVRRRINGLTGEEIIEPNRSPSPRWTSSSFAGSPIAACTCSGRFSASIPGPCWMRSVQRKRRRGNDSGRSRERDST